MERIICEQCGRARHEHYSRGGIFVADKFPVNPCHGFYGRMPTEKEVKKFGETINAPVENDLPWCANCGRARVDHYDTQTGAWILEDCQEYRGAAVQPEFVPPGA